MAQFLSCSMNFKLKNLSDQDVQYSSFRAKLCRIDRRKSSIQSNKHTMPLSLFLSPLFHLHRHSEINSNPNQFVKKQLKDKPRFLSIFLCFFFPSIFILHLYQPSTITLTSNNQTVANLN